MESLVKTYRPVVKFIITFLVVYSVLTVGYRAYLKFSTGMTYYPDYVTNLVAHQTADILNGFGYHTTAIPHPDEPSMKLIVNGKYLSRIVEGCNAISVINLFIAFVVAFSGRFKSTFLFILAGAVILYAANVLRIAIIIMCLYHFPQYQDLLHEVVFPLMIYGMMFLLWMVWVNRFSSLKVKEARSK
ncbi:molecular chaperone GroEL [Mangrovimonas yunxiaonensis]|uniref:Molecular chaperone GroEL n=1 Tax=Mangrovimonas yunxiaonensis TaxID=1197477 RepID=A0A084TM12_9FLAO|nr:exosortase family protein XrtF [Mangrovimonas yunxiaonensis]KFB01748.1 molecular chaperone GroEL [Mangrovimonas yunxiaonensis]